MSADKTEYLSFFLSELIAIPSVNPAFSAPGEGHYGEQRIAGFLEEKAVKAGLSVERQPVVDGRENLLVRLPSRSRHPERRILMAPHLDTVSIHDERQLRPAVRDGKLHGRGACDTKGSVAAMFQALLDVAEKTGGLGKTEIVFAGLVDEECQQLGSRKLASVLPRMDLAIIGEPTECQCVTAHKGNLWQRITVRGQSAHGAQPHLGINAIAGMARLVTALEESYVPSLARTRHPLLGSPTLNTGTIRGGTQANIVPDSCHIEVDRRTLPGESMESFRQEILKVAESLDVEIEFEDAKGVECPPMETDPVIPMVQSFMQATGNSRPLGVNYFCDAAIIRTTGTPCVVFGPGNIDQAHTEDEFIEIGSLIKAHSLLTGFLMQQP